VPKPNWLMMAVAIAAREVYVPWKIRIRQWGALPARRGPTVLITNHQHMDEGENVVRRTFLRHPWKPLVMVNSRRTFETGFFAARLPWTAPFLRRFNASDIWARLSILPVENHLSSRPLLSFAEEIRAHHGNLPLTAILDDATIAGFGLTGCDLDDLWRLKFFARAQGWLKLSRLREPYRQEALERFRATLAGDIARIVDRVRSGATFYVTPEGDFSRTGRMHRMRSGITDAVLPFATPYVCAIAYDPFRGRRLGMLYRIVRPADPADLGHSLAVERPVTASALLGTFLAGREESFTAGDALAAVRAQLRALPARLFVDPELRRRTAAVVDEALAMLVRRGTLARADDRFTLTAQRTDTRFPHVADMVTFQRNMLAESIEAAASLDANAGAALPSR
jgi:hypothetical protein